MRIVPVPPDAAVFSAFGSFVTGPAKSGDRRLYSDWLTPVAGLSLQFHINAVAASALPHVLTQVENHPHAAQAFVPLNVSRYLVTVMPSDAAGRPDAPKAITVVMPGTMGVIYRPGAWHAGITVLDHDAQFAVLMWRGAPDDDVFAAIPPLTILDAQTELTGTTA